MCFYIRKGGKNIKAALYARVSTDIQVEGYSIDAQKDLLLNCAKSKEYNEYEFYIDGGYSGKDLERPEIQRLIQDVIDKKIDCVIVYKLDRISRSQKDTLYLIEEVFNKYNVGFISIRENFDTTSPFGKAMIGILSVFAQLERETILERTRMGQQKRAEAGLWRGGGKIPFPYDYNKENGMLIPNPEKVQTLKKVISMYITGSSFNKISKVIGMDESLVEKRILSKTNLGYIPYKGEYYKAQHEAVITDEMYNNILEVNKIRSKSRTARHYLLSGKIYCGECGAKYRYQKWGKRTICYCYSQQKSKPKFIKNPNCKNGRIDSFEVEDAVLEQLFQLTLDQEALRNDLSTIHVNVSEELESRLQKTKIKIQNLLEYISDGIAIKETTEKLKKVEIEKSELEAQLNETVLSGQKIETTKETIITLQTYWHVMSFDEKRLIIEEIIEKIVINDNSISIHYNL